MKKELEIITYEYRDVKIMVEIDYLRGQISIVERNTIDDFIPKKWIFARRGLEYMNGWQNILDAMKHAVEEATKALLLAKNAENAEISDLDIPQMTRPKNRKL